MSQKTVDIQALESILSFIIKNPDVIEITRKVDEMGVLLILKVDRADMGVVIGRNGEMANAIKKYIKKVGQVNNMNIRLRIDEPTEGEMIVRDDVSVQEVEDVKTNDDKDNNVKSVESDDHDLQEFSLN
jgi:uncharacterized protein